MGDGFSKTQKIIAVMVAFVGLLGAVLGLYTQYYMPVEATLGFEGVESEYVVFDADDSIEVSLFLYNSGSRNAFVDYVVADASFEDESFEVVAGESYELVLEFDALGLDGVEKEVVEVFYDDQKIEQEINLRWGI